MAKEFKYEYDHFDLGYGMHYGVHTVFGDHVALGQGSNMIHIYPYKIYIGADKDKAIPLDQDQQRVIKNIFKVLKRRVEGAQLVPNKHVGNLTGDD